MSAPQHVVAVRSQCGSRDGRDATRRKARQVRPDFVAEDRTSGCSEVGHPNQVGPDLKSAQQVVWATMYGKRRARQDDQRVQRRIDSRHNTTAWTITHSIGSRIDPVIIADITSKRTPIDRASRSLESGARYFYRNWCCRDWLCGVMNRWGEICWKSIEHIEPPPPLKSARKSNQMWSAFWLIHYRNRRPFLY